VFPSPGLNYARGVAVEYLQRRFATVRVPDQSGDAHAPVIGKIKWELQDIVISGLSIPQSAISILPGRGVSVSMYAHPPPRPFLAPFVY
jgi:hypothetical protein